MRIAICDDDVRELSRLTDLINAYRRESAREVIYETFSGGDELLEHMKGGEFDLILLDVLMPGQDGVQVAREIRGFDKAVKLLFLTSSPEFAAESYGVNAFYYLLKPATPKNLFPLLDKAGREMEKQEGDCLLLKERGSVERVSLDTLEYAEVVSKTVFFRMTDGGEHQVSGTLSDFEGELLSRPEFFKVHRSYLLNLRHVQSMSLKGAVTRTGRMVPVARAVYSQARESYMSLLFRHEAPPSQASPAPAVEGCRILLVDDEDDQLSYWAGLLRSGGHTVVCAKSEGDAAARAAAEKFDCVVLDVLLHGGSGFELCRRLRELTGAPVVFLSCLTDADSQMEGFRSGGIDYITKDTPPGLFLKKVETRVKLSRVGRTQARFGPLLIELTAHQVFLEGHELVLTPTEFDLLRCLCEQPGQVCTPEDLYRAVWGQRKWDDGQTIQVHMSRLRRKLEKACPKHYFIETAWGKGYRFTPPA